MSSQNLQQIETVASLLGGFGSVHAIRLEIEPFAELGDDSSSLSGSEVDSSCSRRTILGSAPVTVLQSQQIPNYPEQAIELPEPLPVYGQLGFFALDEIR